jgi:hypothetical protein
MAALGVVEDRLVIAAVRLLGEVGGHVLNDLLRGLGAGLSGDADEIVLARLRHSALFFSAFADFLLHRLRSAALTNGRAAKPMPNRSSPAMIAPPSCRSPWQAKGRRPIREGRP